ncbi:MAG: PH domain-containing protein [Chloroflexi bacterium]|nr:PH domain-containing protein [Chloroflexota bacterium]
MNQLTQDGIAALKAGDKERAQKLFVAALEEDNDDLQAWLWLSGAVESDVDRLECLEQVLRIDPAHALASKGAAQLRARGVKPAEPVETPPEEVFREGFEKYQPEADERLFADPEETAEPDEVPTLSSIEPIAEEPREKTQPVKVENDTRVERSAEKIVLKTKPSLLPVLTVGILIVILVVVLVAVVFPWAVVRVTVNPNLLFMSMLVVVALTIAAVTVRVLQQQFTAYILTNRRLIVEDSLVSRAQKSLPLDRIQGISYRQNFIERIFGLGTVMLAANGENSPIHMQDLKAYIQLAEQIEAAVETQPRE